MFTVLPVSGWMISEWQADRILKDGMLVTVEPGIYIPGWGGVRIENQVVVRSDGAEVLNTLDTALVCLEA